MGIRDPGTNSALLLLTGLVNPLFLQILEKKNFHGRRHHHNIDYSDDNINEATFLTEFENFVTILPFVSSSSRLRVFKKTIFSCEGAAPKVPFVLVTQFKLAMHCGRGRYISVCLESKPPSNLIFSSLSL